LQKLAFREAEQPRIRAIPTRRRPVIPGRYWGEALARLAVCGGPGRKVEWVRNVWPGRKPSTSWPI